MVSEDRLNLLDIKSGVWGHSFTHLANLLLYKEGRFDLQPTRQNTLSVAQQLQHNISSFILYVV